MRKLLIAGLIVMSTGMPVSASDNTDVLAIARSWADAFNRGTSTLPHVPRIPSSLTIFSRMSGKGPTRVPSGIRPSRPGPRRQR